MTKKGIVDSLRQNKDHIIEQYKSGQTCSQIGDQRFLENYMERYPNQLAAAA